MSEKNCCERSWRASMILVLALCAAAACERRPPAKGISAEVIIPPSRDGSIGRRIRSVAAAVPAKAMAGPGLAGAMGGIHVRFLSGGSFQMRIPMPLAIDGQVPVWYGISSGTRAMPVEFSLHREEGSAYFVGAKLSGREGQEVVVGWSAVILIAGQAMLEERVRPEEYRAASPCAQSEAGAIRELASALWPDNGMEAAYARNVQRHILGMRQKERTWSLDALGILKSGQGGICTANANLACSLFRAKGIPCRSLAVIPPISRLLEMHRIVAYHAGNEWIPFDPSLLQPDIPLKPWHAIVMAKSSMAAEGMSMRPRVGAMRGCPYGQEAEIAGSGLSLHGDDFFWTLAVPLASFVVDEETFALTTKAWERFLISGMCETGQAAARAGDLARFRAALKGE